MLFGDSKASLAFEKECKFKEGNQKKKYNGFYKYFSTVFKEFKTHLNCLEEITTKKTRVMMLSLLRKEFLKRIDELKKKNFETLSIVNSDEEYLFNLMKNILIIEYRKHLREALENRYVYDKRVGCIAILDTLHVDYKKRLNGERNGLASDDSDVVYYEVGEWKDGKWTVDDQKSKNVIEHLKLLNQKCIIKTFIVNKLTVNNLN